jgi:hypothetical protein
VPKGTLCIRWFFHRESSRIYLHRFRGYPYFPMPLRSGGAASGNLAAGRENNRQLIHGQRKGDRTDHF